MPDTVLRVKDTIMPEIPVVLARVKVRDGGKSH